MIAYNSFVASESASKCTNLFTDDNTNFTLISYLVSSGLAPKTVSIVCSWNN